jgi:hypothetical protein
MNVFTCELWRAHVVMAFALDASPLVVLSLYGTESTAREPTAP